MIILTRDEFLEATGVDLYLELEDADVDIEKMVDITLKRWSTILYTEVRKKSLTRIPDDSKLTSNQVERIKEALCNLGLYYKTNGDIKALGGTSTTGEEVVPQDIIDDLRRTAGLIKLSFGGRSVW